MTLNLISCKELDAMDFTYPKVEIIDGMVKIYDAEDVLPYEFALDRIDSPIKLLGWIRHLNEKTWFTGPCANRLIDAIYKHHGWQFPYGV